MISRNFNGVIYKLYLEDRGESYEGLKLGTGIDDPAYDFPAAGGEKCTAPSYIPKENVFKMIDDLPLTTEQKDEMKQHVWVIPVIHGGFF